MDGQLNYWTGVHIFVGKPYLFPPSELNIFPPFRNIMQGNRPLGLATKIHKRTVGAPFIYFNKKPATFFLVKFDGTNQIRVAKATKRSINNIRCLPMVLSI
jgi:hypothetical protein